MLRTAEKAFPFALPVMDSLLAQKPTPLGKQPVGLDLSIVVLPGLSYYLVHATSAHLVWGTC